MKKNHVYSKLYYHVIWKTKNKQPIIMPEFKDDLYHYIGQIVKTKGWHLIAIGGIHDHIHILVQMEPQNTISDLVCKIKSNSSRLIKTQFMADFAWQEGYGVFSVDRHSIKRIKNYILNQEQHHNVKRN
ncbi:MAG: Transposase [candidate division TM6 bacterium GW2011_GWF2_28_16]|nr:MAG: Transposase [candidate division TM6 bacterium GW2011_GWF2_28_16]